MNIDDEHGHSPYRLLAILFIVATRNMGKVLRDNAYFYPHHATSSTPLK